MPRKRKAARAYRKPGEFTDAQRETLLYGQPILNHTEADDFRNESEMLAGWLANRESLMREYAYHSGERCWAWWRFVRGREKPREWWEEFAELDRLKQIDSAELAAFVRLHKLNDRAMPDPEGSAASTVSAWRRYDYGEYVTRQHAAESEFRAAWHAGRGETALARFHALVAAGLRDVLEGTHAKTT